jgi:hypothetical protein
MRFDRLTLFSLHFKVCGKLRVKRLNRMHLYGTDERFGGEFAKRKPLGFFV